MKATFIFALSASYEKAFQVCRSVNAHVLKPHCCGKKLLESAVEEGCAINIRNLE